MDAKTWINNTTNLVEISGECPADLAAAAKQIGYYNGFNRDGISVFDVMAELQENCPEGFIVVCPHFTSLPPEHVRVGQYVVRHGDPEYSFYVVRDVSLAAALLGKRGGSARTSAKQAASRANGKLGGRPKYTYDHKFQAHYGAGIIIVPDQVADDQRKWATDGNKSFPAIRSNGDKTRVCLDPDAYGLFTSGTGDMVVISA